MTFVAILFFLGLPYVIYKGLFCEPDDPFTLPWDKQKPKNKIDRYI